MATALGLAGLVTSANALTIQNTDKVPYTLKVTPTGGKAGDVTVKAHATADVDCKTGCAIILGKANTSVDAKTMKLVIKNGKLS